jgi:hypothetical protein
MTKPLSIILLLLLLSAVASAQHPYNSTRDALGTAAWYGRHEIRLSAGAFSTDQLIGIKTNYDTGFDFPQTISGADFIAYRYYAAKWLAIGAALGADYQKGNRTNYSRGNDNAIIGKYDRCAYTAALEFTFIVIDKQRFQLYGGLAPGCTLYKATSTLSKDYYNRLPYTRQPLAQDEVNHEQSTHFNGQFTPLGIKSNGPLSFFFELGYGYKGVLCMGLCGRF